MKKFNFKKMGRAIIFCFLLSASFMFFIFGCRKEVAQQFQSENKNTFVGVDSREQFSVTHA